MMIRKLWLSLAWLASFAVVLGAGGVAALAVEEHGRVERHAARATAIGDAIRSSSTVVYEFRNGEPANASTLAAARRDENGAIADRNQLALAAPLVILVGLAVVWGFYAWGLWLVAPAKPRRRRAARVRRLGDADPSDVGLFSVDEVRGAVPDRAHTRGG